MRTNSLLLFLGCLCMSLIVLFNGLISPWMVTKVISIVGSGLWGYLAVKHLISLYKNPKGLLLEYDFTPHITPRNGETTESTMLKIQKSLKELPFVEYVTFEGQTIKITMKDRVFSEELALRIGVLMGTIDAQERALNIIKKNFENSGIQVMPNSPNQN